MGMTDVGRQCQHLLIDIDPLRLPAQNPVDDKGMPQIMNAWRSVGTAVDPTELLTQLLEEPIDLTP